jgi:hypothetical protein
VITREFIDALNLTDLQGAAEWSTASDSIPNNGDATFFTFSTYYQTRGVRAGTQQRNFFSQYGDNDTFDLERIELQASVSDDLGAGPRAQRLVWIDVTDLLLEVGGDEFASSVEDAAARLAAVSLSVYVFVPAEAPSATMAVACATVLLVVAMTFVMTSSDARVTAARLADVSPTVAIVTVPALPALMSSVARAALAAKELFSPITKASKTRSEPSRRSLLQSTWPCRT